MRDDAVSARVGARNRTMSFAEDFIPPRSLRFTTERAETRVTIVARLFFLSHYLSLLLCVRYTILSRSILLFYLVSLHSSLCRGPISSQRAAISARVSLADRYTYIRAYPCSLSTRTVALINVHSRKKRIVPFRETVTANCDLRALGIIAACAVTRSSIFYPDR